MDTCFHLILSRNITGKFPRCRCHNFFPVLLFFQFRPSILEYNFQSLLLKIKREFCLWGKEVLISAKQYLQRIESIGQASHLFSRLLDKAQRYIFGNRVKNGLQVIGRGRVVLVRRTARELRQKGLVYLAETDGVDFYILVL